MLNNEPPYELTEFDPVRYGEWATPAFTAAKVKESYGQLPRVFRPKAMRACTLSYIHKATRPHAQAGTTTL